MRQIIFLLLLFVSFSLVFAGAVHGQQSHEIIFPPKKDTVKKGFPPHRDFPPHKSPYKKKDTVVKVSVYDLDTLVHHIPLGRQLFHDKIDNEQKTADAADGKTDHIITYKPDSALTPVLTKALLTDVDRLQIMIENMPPNGREATMENQEKIRCLTALRELVVQYNNDPKPDPLFYKNLVANMREMLIASNENKLMAFAKANVNVYTLDNGKKLWDTYPEVRAYIYVQMGKADPRLMIRRLSEYATDTFAGEIIKEAAKLEPEVVFNYAMSTNFPLKNAVYHTQDTLVQSIVKIAAEAQSPLKALPLLGYVYHNTKTIGQVDRITADTALYFGSLVRLKIADDSVARNVYNQELTYRALQYVRLMNELHEEKDEVRFRCIDSLSAESLYYLMVYGQDEIYTSSFLGTYKRMAERMAPMKGNQLLDSLHNDHFRTFIRMCAGYNTLADFLGTMDDTTRTTVMTHFIGGLEKGKEDDLEDAVDVADAFGSIRDSSLAAFLQKKVKDNYEQAFESKSRKGVVVYGILASLFEGNRIADNDTGASITSARLHLPLINKVPYKDLVNDSGIVYQQAFFFGDKDGEDSYESFLGSFKNDKRWTINTDNKNWTVISATGDHKVVIYANLPIQDPQGADELAQDSLCKYLDSNHIHPTVMIHRGHSYHLPQTLSKLNNGVKIVIVGSCGGYHNLSMVLDHAPDAHIVSSKQIGTHGVNEPIIRAMNERLLQGQDINWIGMWQELDTFFADKPDLKDKFSDYVPPYKNLGAIFIKAYRRMINNDSMPE